MHAYVYNTILCSSIIIILHAILYSTDVHTYIHCKYIKIYIHSTEYYNIHTVFCECMMSSSVLCLYKYVHMYIHTYVHCMLVIVTTIGKITSAMQSINGASLKGQQSGIQTAVSVT